jgi:hypothetical protein
MKRVSIILDVLIIVLLVSLFIVPAVFAQDGDPNSFLWEPFAPILAVSATVERSIQLVRRLVSSDLETGPLARNSKALKYFTTFGSLAMGLMLSFWGQIRLLYSVNVLVDPTLDYVLTGIVAGMGSELVHEIIGVAIEGKEALRANAKREDAVG